MSDVKYNTICIVVFLVAIIVAAIIDDLGIVFEFVSSFTQVFLSFIGPGYLYVVAERMFGDAESRDKRRFDIFVSKFMVFFGGSIFFIVLAANIYDFI